jgi:hypothetical protein
VRVEHPILPIGQDLGDAGHETASIAEGFRGM